MSNWPALPTASEYIALRSECERIAQRITLFRNLIREFSDVLRDDPRRSKDGIPQDWLSADDLRQLLADAGRAWDRMDDAWAALSTEERENLKPPLKEVAPIPVIGRGVSR